MATNESPIECKGTIRLRHAVARCRASVHRAWASFTVRVTQAGVRGHAAGRGFFRRNASSSVSRYAPAYGFVQPNDLIINRLLDEPGPERGLHREYVFGNCPGWSFCRDDARLSARCTPAIAAVDARFEPWCLIKRRFEASLSLGLWAPISRPL